MFVPVKDSEGRRLMPTTPGRARRWIRSGRATPYWDHGVFCVRLNEEPSNRVLQPVVVGIDPGSKREGFTIKSAAHTYLNIQATAVDWVKDTIEVRRNMRRARRYRKTPYRANRKNRCRGAIPPSTKARWQWKLRLARWLTKMFPITMFVVEDIKARTLGKKRWDSMFSPLEIGKAWFYVKLGKLAKVETKQGWETKELRDALGLKKSNAKLSDRFDAHCVDSWVLANSITGGHSKPDNEQLLLITPLRFHRRQLHVFQPGKGGVRRLYGSTRSLGLKRGSLVRHTRRGVCYVGGTSGSQLSLHEVVTGKRLGQSFKMEDCKFLCFNSWRTAIPPRA